MGELHDGMDSILDPVTEHRREKLAGVLRRAEELYNANQSQTPGPIMFILHGPEGRVFLRGDYDENRSLVDLAARLSALNVVTIHVCETWMRSQGLDSAELLPFVGTVPNGPAEIRRLLAEEQYRYF